jgi:hypothetical protein
LVESAPSIRQAPAQQAADVGKEGFRFVRREIADGRSGKEADQRPAPNLSGSVISAVKSARMGATSSAG